MLLSYFEPGVVHFLLGLIAVMLQNVFSSSSGDTFFNWTVISRAAKTLKRRLNMLCGLIKKKNAPFRYLPASCSSQLLFRTNNNHVQGKFHWCVRHLFPRYLRALHSVRFSGTSVGFPLSVLFSRWIQEAPRIMQIQRRAQFVACLTADLLIT